MAHIRSLQDFFDEAGDIFFDSPLSNAEKDEKIVALRSEHSRHFPIKDSNYYYFLGYTGYLAKDLGEETESYFKEALRLDPKNNFCQYYYAYFLFDSKRYKEALKVLEDIDLTNFEDSGLTLRIFKIQEAIACCSLFLADYTERDKIEKIDKFLTEYEKHVMIEENNYDDPINSPRELIHSVSESLDNLSGGFTPVLVKLTALMKREELETTYEREFNRFKHFIQLPDVAAP